MPGGAIKPNEDRSIIAESNRIGPPLQAIYRDQYKLILNRGTGRSRSSTWTKTPASSRTCSATRNPTRRI